MRIRLDRFPQGVTKALTLSYDDGKLHDRRLVRILNEYGIKGTFHLNSGFLGKEGYIEASEVASLFAGHEVSAHTIDHPFLEQSPMDQVVREISRDREALESLVGYPVRGMSYPFGTYSEQVVQALPTLGIEYARTVASHGGFQMPQDFLRWHPTCHHKNMLERADAFVQLEQRHSRMSLLYVWGHSYEFENDNNWEMLEEFGEKVKGRSDIWFATNAEIVAYMQAVERLRFSANCQMIHNPSAIPVWISVEGEQVVVPAGQIINI
ncbi:polysaccharide deacetylase family protein [Paenibacillus qinlingensis]|uniref:Peptidoglycan/xylan/chitin deacetylase (PgdA/CDA1 family) n=1 Tax=Paenibacillus qinlingensis TaxID=1837343 RepID=A0ABU1NP23_9BACL|nr:polysaccharide deacetylase family protein [Paenibacillus qinlingensis]MDR6549234.1 peptidoglycan/xylan/chitin deacetylase (PgdA/CDA1 family) [Paenibacillus qinlingensis]